jgi:hypothetical protein
MGMIMVIVLFSRLFMMPVYMSELEMIGAIADSTSEILSNISFATLALALLAGALAILAALVKGISQHKKEQADYAASVADS